MPSFSDGPGSLSIQNTERHLGSILQAGYVTVADESWPQLALSVRFAVLNFEIENAYAVARLTLINAPVTRANHYPVPGFLFPTQINHRVSNRRIALD